MTAALSLQEEATPLARRQPAASLLSCRPPFDLPPTHQLLTEGGDARILLDPITGLNKYGCATIPDPALLAFGSSTASVISGPGFAAAGRLRQKIIRAAAHQHPSTIHARELDRIAGKLLHLCGLPAREGTQILFAASGTDLHSLAAKITGRDNKPSLAIMVEASETGSGVGAALGAVNANNVANVALRLADGTPRPAAAVDAEVEALVAIAAAQGRHVLLTMVDVSKTGLIAPSLGCVLDLQRRFPEALDILVDACQFRLSPAMLRAYLAQGFMVMVTGSKFMTGPTFSGALLIPRAKAAKASDLGTNFGLLLRWEAALNEFSAFNSLPDEKISSFLQSFAAAINDRLQSDVVFAPVAVPELDRQPLVAEPGWDQLQTIFSFTLHHPVAGALTADETARIYHQLQADAPRCQLGQPVACGTKASALRLCLSARLIVEALSDNGLRADAVIGSALAALDKTAHLVRRLSPGLAA